MTVDLEQNDVQVIYAKKMMLANKFAQDQREPISGTTFFYYSHFSIHVPTNECIILCNFNVNSFLCCYILMI